jgi:hypothetical protein
MAKEKITIPALPVLYRRVDRGPISEKVTQSSIGSSPL